MTATDALAAGARGGRQRQETHGTVGTWELHVSTVGMRRGSLHGGTAPMDMLTCQAA